MEKRYTVMSTARELTYAQLRAKCACANQLALFKSTFGKSVIVDVALCQRVASQFDFDWAARNLLSPTALAEYERGKATALAKYEGVREPAWAEYARSSTATALAEYTRFWAAAWDEYTRGKATAFAIGFINDTKGVLVCG